MTAFVSVALLVIVTFSFLFADARHFFMYWLHLVILQNVVSGLWFSDAEGSVPLVVTEAKTIAIVLALIFHIPKIVKIASTDKLLLSGIVVYAIGLLSNITSFSPVAIATLRNFTVTIAVLFVALACSASTELKERANFLRVILAATTFWLVTGAIGEFFVTTGDWRDFFNADALGGLNSLSETTSLFGVELARIGGFLLEPVNAGYMAASVLVVLWVLRFAERERLHSTTDILCFAGSLFALASAATKNGLMMFFIAAIARLLLSRSMSPRLVVLWSGAAAFVVTLGYATLVKGPAYLQAVFTNPVAASGGESTSIHMAGLVSGFQSLIATPFGHGLGTGGNFLKLFDPTVTRVAWLSTGSESAWGTLAYQGGILCVAGLVVIVLQMARSLGPGSTVLLAVWASAALFAESFFGPIASSVLMIAAAYVGVHSERLELVQPTKMVQRLRN
ncbi:hypothetical protein [Pseudarthrobacter sp. CCNWLW207]|uniref:hypothetical protein n=1 Tax=Pseudarthrobacter sp. CCNWLW207 TaxID=3127468 RepID=UPI003077534A